MFVRLNLKFSQGSVAVLVFSFSVSGLLLVVVHSGERLLAMDDDGFSDPYCIVAANKEKVRFSQICLQLSFFQGGKSFRSFGTQYMAAM